MTKKLHLVSEETPSNFDVSSLKYPRDRFDLISVDKIQHFILPYKQKTRSIVRDYTRNYTTVAVTLRCKKCGTVKQVIDKATIGCKEGPCSSWWKDLTGQRFGRLTVLACEKVSYRPGAPEKWYWKCKCDCGTVCYKSTHALLNTSTLECNSCAVSTKRRKLTMPDGGSGWNTAFHSTQKNAEKRGYVFELSLRQFKEICSRPCYYCGRQPGVPLKAGRDKKVVGWRNGVDRFDNKRGYTVDNCVPCCPLCNAMKSDLSYKEWIDLMTNILAHCKERSTTISKESTPKRVETGSV